MDALPLLPGPGFLVLVVDEGTELHGVVLRPNLHRRGDNGLDILLEKMQADQRRADADEQNGPQREKDALEHAEYIAKRRSPRSPPAGGRMGRLLPSSVLLQSWNTSF